MEPVEKLISPSQFADEGINLKAVAQTLRVNFKLISLVTIAGFALSTAHQLALPNQYSATLTILPLDPTSDRTSSAMASLGAIGNLAAAQAGMGLKGTLSDKFVAFLRSRTVTEMVIAKHDLLPVLFSKHWDAAHSRWRTGTREYSFSWPFIRTFDNPPTMANGQELLATMLKPHIDLKTGIVSITIEAGNPKIAADIANYYGTELNNYLRNNSFSSSIRNRDFLEKQVVDVSNSLSIIEKKLKRFQEDNKLVAIDAQTQAMVQTYGNLRTQLISKEMELELLKGSTSESDLQRIGLSQEVESLKNQINGLETGASNEDVSLKKAPELQLKYAQLKRDLLIKEKVFELLTQQLELAKVDSSKEAFSFQVIDTAVPPSRHSKPKRAFNIMVLTALSLLAGIVITYVKESLSQSSRNRLG